MKYKWAMFKAYIVEAAVRSCGQNQLVDISSEGGCQAGLVGPEVS